MEHTIEALSETKKPDIVMVDPLQHFVVAVVRVIIEPHPDADKLELAKVDDYLSVVGKGSFQQNQLVAYLPEDSLIPTDLAMKWVDLGHLPQDISIKKNGLRIRPKRLRGVLSQGIVIPAEPDWIENQDVKDILGITKWEPEECPMPVYKPRKSGSKKLQNPDIRWYEAGPERCIKYGIENIKRFPKVISEGEPCIFTEKIHGTWLQVGVMPDALAHPQYGKVIITSKGLGGKGLALLPPLKENLANLYIGTAEDLGVPEKIEKVFQKELSEGKPVFVLGEIFGEGIQDLGYGVEKTQPSFRVFDIFIGKANFVNSYYLNDEQLEVACLQLELPRVPVLYRGPFSKALALEYTNGKETISGKHVHIREGIVIRTQVERYYLRLRIQFKSISEDYLLRKNGTEYH